MTFRLLVQSVQKSGHKSNKRDIFSGQFMGPKHVNTFGSFTPLPALHNSASCTELYRNTAMKYLSSSLSIPSGRD